MKLINILVLVLVSTVFTTVFAMEETGPVIFLTSADGQRKVISIQLENYQNIYAGEESVLTVSLYDSVGKVNVDLNEITPILSQRTDAGIDEIIRNFYFQNLDTGEVLFPNSSMVTPVYSFDLSVVFPKAGRWLFYFQLLNKSDASTAFTPYIMFKVNPQE